MQHLRSTPHQEWSSFSTTSQKQLSIRFKAEKNFQTLAVTQQDVRRAWAIELNGKSLGKLQDDENKIVAYYSIPDNTLKRTNNRLVIRQTDTAADDIRIGDIQLFTESLLGLIYQSTVTVTVTDRNTGVEIPSRITIVNTNKALQPVAGASNLKVAVRTGCVYTDAGNATFVLPEGKYVLYATRGFEYGVDSVTIEAKKGKQIVHEFSIAKEVQTEDWISCDPHLHTYTHSGHGDATAQERIITIAGEGIELPVITDHNKAINLDSIAKRLQLDSFFTLVTGNEFTTRIGHFNVFPVNSEFPVPNSQVNNWKEVEKRLVSNNDKIVILNHARDVHQGFRPFGAERHVQLTGQNLQGWKLPANAMEVMNSGSQQSDIMQLYRDWFGMMNAGFKLTPVGSSDSHDVFRFLAGQSRTYIRYEGEDPSKINIKQATENFIQGKVVVSFGLFVEVIVDKQYGPGELVPASDEVVIDVRVLAPSWIKADTVELYVNGRLTRSELVSSERNDGFKWEGYWLLPVRQEDLFIVVVARGKDPKVPFWPIPNPYQKTSSSWEPLVIGSSGVIWIDGDGNGEKTSAYENAEITIESINGDLKALMHELGLYDENVAIQAAIILKKMAVPKADIEKALKTASEEVRNNFRKGYK